MKEWNFKVFVDKRGVIDFYHWLEQQPKKAKVKIRKHIAHLEITSYWSYRPYAAKLKGTNEIWEIIIKHNTNEYRPLGYFGPDEKTFTILIGAKEDNGKFVPRTAIETAEKRLKLIQENRRHIDDFV